MKLLSEQPTLNGLTDHTRRALRNFAENPTQRNQCYMTGYLHALNEHDLISDAAYADLMGFLRLLDQAETEAETEAEINDLMESQNEPD